MDRDGSGRQVRVVVSLELVQVQPGQSYNVRNQPPEQTHSAPLPSQQLAPPLPPLRSTHSADVPPRYADPVELSKGPSSMPSSRAALPPPDGCSCSCRGGSSSPGPAAQAGLQPPPLPLVTVVDCRNPDCPYRPKTVNVVPPYPVPSPLPTPPPPPRTPPSPLPPPPALRTEAVPPRTRAGCACHTPPLRLSRGLMPQLWPVTPRAARGDSRLSGHGRGEDRVGAGAQRAQAAAALETLTLRVRWIGADGFAQAVDQASRPMRSLDLVLLPLLLLLTLLMRGCVEGQQQGLHVKGPESSMADHGEFGFGVDGDWDSMRESVRKAMSETVSHQPQHKTVSKTLSKQTVSFGRPQVKIGPNNKIPPKAVSHNSRCQEPPKRVLRQILGPAFIDMYMMDELSPKEIDSSLGLSDETSLNKRWQRQSILAHESSRPFYLTEDFQEPLSEEPAWELKYDTTGVAIDADSSGNYRTAKGRRHIMLSADSSNVDMLGEGSGGSMAREDAGDLRVKRSRTPVDERLWHCEAPIRFRDLGENYYPRYIREVDCSGCPEEPEVKCKSRNFEVRVLRRQDECAPISHMPGFVLIDETSLHEGMWRKWIVERVSVSFCCVCGRF